MGVEESRAVEKLGRVRGFPEHEQNSAWYRRRREELQQQKVALLGERKFKPKVRMKLKKQA